MSGHLDGPRPPKLPGPPDPPYIEGDLGSPSREEFDIQRGAANADVTYEHPKGCDPATVFQRQRVAALNRIAAELRGQLRDAPADDPDVAAILRDCDTLEEVAAMLGRSVPVTSALSQPGLAATTPAA